MTVLTEPAFPSFDFVDMHCHIDLFSDPTSLVSEAALERVLTVAVTNAPFVFEHTRILARQSAFVRPALGLHPELVKSHGHEVDLICARLHDVRFVGEIGLDYTTDDQKERAMQRGVFTKILERCARANNKILTIHSRRAASDVVSAIGQKFPCSTILHWFTGSPRELEGAIIAGCYFSVNAPMLTSKSGRTLIALMPRDRVLTESDGPFTRARGRLSSPSSMRVVVSLLAQAWNVSFEDARVQVIKNFGTCANPDGRAAAHR